MCPLAGLLLELSISVMFVVLLGLHFCVYMWDTVIEQQEADNG